MNNDETIDGMLAAMEHRRAERRSFLRMAGGASAALAGTALLAGCGNDDDDDLIVTPTPTPGPTPTPPTGGAPTDADVLNFALNLEYLEAQFYAYATTGAGLAASLLTGTGTQGAVTGGRQVPFRDPLVARYAREIAEDERAHVAFLRRGLGTAAVAQPAIDIGVGPSTAFSAAARAAGLIGAGATFNPYENDENFLLGAFIFEDVGVSAYKGASVLLTKTFLEPAAGILAAEAYHAGLIRTVLYRKGIGVPGVAANGALIDATEAISNARDQLDGPIDRDQGIRVRDGASNIVPADADAIAFSRTPGQTLNIVYLNPAVVTAGGFFPNGVNGSVRTSAAN